MTKGKLQLRYLPYIWERKAFLEVLLNRFLFTSHWPELATWFTPRGRVIVSNIYIAAPSKIEVMNPYVNGLCLSVAATEAKR